MYKLLFTIDYCYMQVCLSLRTINIMMQSKGNPTHTLCTKTPFFLVAFRRSISKTTNWPDAFSCWEFTSNVKKERERKSWQISLLSCQFVVMEEHCSLPRFFPLSLLQISPFYILPSIQAVNLLSWGITAVFFSLSILLVFLRKYAVKRADYYMALQAASLSLDLSI